MFLLISLFLKIQGGEVNIKILSCLFENEVQRKTIGKYCKSFKFDNIMLDSFVSCKKKKFEKLAQFCLQIVALATLKTTTIHYNCPARSGKVPFHPC